MKLKRGRARRPSAFKMVALAWSFWRWLPPAQRRTLLTLLRKQAPKLAKRQLARRRKR